MKIRQAKVAARRKAWTLKKKADVPLEDNSDADVDADDLLYNEKDHIDDELSTDDELIRHYKDSSDEEEVLPITDDEKEDSDDEKEDFDEEEEDSDEEKGN
ncbi:hypothetical protein TNCT_9571 [Trichonephila clavata]|uniref:Uncharacterized protein n=1 Tax=Trichonephila clavata TaxID=2740835 RepID=A0A8X6LFF5_TRICU|nr:hypothetical protein TNCT_9571 [Trichonephila clavata]